MKKCNTILSPCLLRFASVLFVVISLELVNAAPVVENQSQATIYLATFGYLNPPQENSNGSTPNEIATLPDTVIKDAIKDFQSFAGIKKTGELDAETLRYMNEKRCGLSDKISQPGHRWTIKDLTYRITKYSEDMLKSETDKEVARALQVWADVTDLTFTMKASGRVNIEIGFYSGHHNNEASLNAFDGRGGVLAHAFYPQSGSTHFDATEPWTVNSTMGVNLYQVAAHEFGHALGLSHIEGERESLMAPFFKGYKPQFSLHTKDIEAIHGLYGAKTAKSSGRTTSRDYPPTTPIPTTPRYHVTTPKSDIELCRDGHFDTIFTSKENITYVFKGEKYWELTRTGIAPGYPQKISKTWTNLPTYVNAAFTYRNGKTYFFIGSRYWRYTGLRLDRGYPREISDPTGFPGIPDDLDTAFAMHGEKEIYFFKGRSFWKFHPDKEPHIEAGYPKSITTQWRGLPESIGSGMVYRDHHLYIFKNNDYYRMDTRTLSVAFDDPSYPKRTDKFWFDCPLSESSFQGTGVSNEQSNVNRNLP